MLVSIIVPAYNEEELLPDFLKEVTTYLKKARLDYELVVVENGSQDKTLKIAKEFAKKNKKVKVERLLKPNYGKALLYGLRKAKGDYLVIFNVDYWDKRFIELVKVNLNNADIIIGSKNLPGSRDFRPFWRRLITKSLNLSLRLLFGFSGTDTHGIKVLRRVKISPILKKLQTETGIFDTELVIRAQRAGLKIQELPVEVIEKRPNRFGFKRILETPRDIIKLYLALRS